jgi:PHD/YefM family antitoxin component YafN of YafNO toxin-antitoxin module
LVALEVLYVFCFVLYYLRMVTMKMSAARDKLPEVVELARSEAVILERYGHPAAVLISPERYDELMTAFEDAEDVAAFDAAIAEEGPNIPWEQVKADLGWT